MAEGKLDFSALTVMAALEVALLMEEDARDRYSELARRFASNAPVADFFKRMSKAESHHARGLLQRRRAFDDDDFTVTDDMIPKMETPLPDDPAAATPKHALELALMAEQKSAAFYAAALSEIRDPQVKQLFTSLEHDEREHEKLVRKELDRLAA